MKLLPLSAAQILAEIAKISSMEVGKLSEYILPGRAKDSGPYYKHQAWQNGKNVTRHVRPEQVPSLKEALEGYARFQQLTEQYAQLIIAQTRTRLEEDVKKKIRPYSRHSKRKSSGSSNP